MNEPGVEPRQSLLSLPLELLDRIVSLCPCSTILRIVRVNRQLRGICHTKLTYERKIRNHFFVEDISSELWNPGEVFGPLSPLETARVAYMIEKADKLTRVQRYSEAAGGLVSDIYRWLPQLMSLHHPINEEISISLLLDIAWNIFSDSERRERPSILYGVEYCLTMLILSERLQDEPFMIHTFERIDTWPRINFYGQGGANLWYNVRNYEDLYALNDASFPILIEPWRPLAIISAFSGILTQIGKDFKAPLPRSSLIPFSSLMGLVPMFRGISEAFHTCHLDLMTSSEFLCTGDWVGLYSHVEQGPHYHGRATFNMNDPPMFGIRFRRKSLGQPSDGIKIKIEDSGRSTDQIGDFRISGDVYEDGTVRLVKKYTERRFSWDWIGRVTPFVWKLDWCPKQL